MIIQRGNQVEPQPKPLAPIAVTLGQNPKDFQAADDVLNDEPLPRKLTVLLLLLVRQRMMLAFLLREAAVAMQLR